MVPACKQAAQEEDMRQLDHLAWKTFDQSTSHSERPTIATENISVAMGPTPE